MNKYLKFGMIISLVIFAIGCSGQASGDGEVAYLPTPTPEQRLLTAQPIPTLDPDIQPMRPAADFQPHSLEDATEQEIFDYALNFLYWDHLVLERPSVGFVEPGSEELLQMVTATESLTDFAEPYDQYVVVFYHGDFNSHSARPPQSGIADQQTDFAMYVLYRDTGMKFYYASGPLAPFYDRPGNHSDTGERIHPDPFPTFLEMAETW